MAQNSRDNLQRERHVLWNLKRLMLRFRGDDAWVPVGKVETSHDILLLDPNALSATTTHSLANETDNSVNESAMFVENNSTISANSGAPAAVQISVPDGANPVDMISNGIEAADMALGEQIQPPLDEAGRTLEQQSLSAPSLAQEKSVPPTRQTSPHEQDDRPLSNGHVPSDQRDHDMDSADGVTHLQSPKPAESASPDSSSNQPSHRMTTRARARSPTSPTQDGSPSPSPAPSSIPPVHGFFNVPSLAMPDRDFGLPTSEAEDTRRLLILFVQKQEQVVREAHQMFERLMRADRMRKDVYRWFRAEAHVGEMSDGEDWYDKDEWKLDADLVKGKEEEELEEEGRGKGRRRRGAQH